MPQEEKQPTNAVLSEKLDGLKLLVEEKFRVNFSEHNLINEHLAVLNGQVIMNTDSRIRKEAVEKYKSLRISVYLGIAGIGLPILVSMVIAKYF